LPDFDKVRVISRPGPHTGPSALGIGSAPTQPEIVKGFNRVVGGILQSPVHPLLSGGIDLVRYEGHRSGRTITTPTQYARMGEDVVILVGHPERKTWWRNFEAEREVDLLVRGAWLRLRARVVRGSDEPGVARPLLDAYLHRFPRAARALGDGSDADRLERAVIVWGRAR
jgi:hypothetical protein